MKNKHSEIIKAWADGTRIERRLSKYVWIDTDLPVYESEEYRIKPEPKPDVIDYLFVGDKKFDETPEINWVFENTANLKLTWDGETGKLKSAEVINE
jgi:hypothetical protein